MTVVLSPLNGIDVFSHCLNIFGLSLWDLLNTWVAPFDVIPPSQLLTVL
jgi:hypothetical protein